ncbi:MAG TPA: PilN domain-containing protein [Gemmatimonadaceae bacterium]|nr:PilN domain-containing protein [Gemmatimonadaceae bacterium]
MVKTAAAGPSSGMLRPPTGAKTRVRTGIAISPTSLVAADVRLRAANGVWRAALEPAAADATSWPSLARALAELAAALGVSDGTLAVSLMSPLIEVRRLDLPPVRPDELQQLLARNAARYFVNARGPQVVGAAPTVRRGRGAPVPVVAAAASARLVAAIHAAASESGWTIESITPAEGAWAAAALDAWPVLARQSAYTVIASADRTDVLQLENGRLVAVRRFRAGAADAEMIADTMGSMARVGISGDAGARKELAAALSLRGASVLTPASGSGREGDGPELLAAQYAGAEIGPVLRSDDRVAGERLRARSAAWWMVAASAVLLAAAAGVQYWGVSRQLRMVRAERARLRPELNTTLLGRTTVDAAYAQLAALDTIDRTAPRWSATIATLSQTIPDEAHLAAIRTRGDSLIVDGLADHAARVFDALSKTRGLADVKSAASVRRAAEEGGAAKEHFTIAARVEQLPARKAAP